MKAEKTDFADFAEISRFNINLIYKTVSILYK